MNALCIRQGMTVVHESSWSGLDTMQTVGRVKSVLADFPPMAAIKVDVIGIGAGVADRLREDSYRVVDVNVAAASREPENFANLRHELWWTLRELFRDGEINGPIDDTTMGQLSSVRYKYDSKHARPVVESKEDMKKRGIRSPDRAEALMLAFTSPPVKQPPSVAPQGTIQRSDWR
jgi:phage terminase large subunit